MAPTSSVRDNERLELVKRFGYIRLRNTTILTDDAEVPPNACLLHASRHGVVDVQC